MPTSTEASPMECDGTITKEAVKRLIEERDELDKYIATQAAILEENKIDMKEPLVDAEGFPRADIDVYAVRNARVNIIRSNNDRQALTDRIEKALHELHATMGPGDAGVPRAPPRPIARVDEVKDYSPAKTAGLQVGDLVLTFGSVNAENFSTLRQIGDVTKNSVNTPLNVRIMRNGATTTLQLIPKAWSGDGLLGCLLRPV